MVGGGRRVALLRRCLPRGAPGTDGIGHLRAARRALRRLPSHDLRRRHGPAGAVKLGPAWSSPAERQRWEESLNAWADTLPPPPAAPAAPKPRRQPARRSLPAPRPTRRFATVSAMIINDGRLSATDMKMALWLLSTARGRASINAFIEQIAEAIGRSIRMVQYAQRNLERCGYITVEHVREGRINDANVYHLLAPLHAPAPRCQRPSRREARGVQKTPAHEEASERT